MSEAIDRMFAKLKEMNLQLGGITIPPGEREIDSDQVADNIYAVLCDMQNGNTEEVDHEAEQNAKLNAFKERYAHLDDEFVSKP